MSSRAMAIFCALIANYSNNQLTAVRGLFTLPMVSLPLVVDPPGTLRDVHNPFLAIV